VHGIEEIKKLKGRARRTAAYGAAHARAEVSLRLARARGSNVTWGPNAEFWANSRFTFKVPGEMTIGERLILRGKPLGVRFITGPEGKIVIGDHAGFNSGVEVYAEELIEIGDYTMAGSNVTIYDTNFHPLEEVVGIKQAPVKIGYNVWLARGATVLPGATIGDQAVVGAGAVVSGDVPPRTLVAGNPATVVRELTASETWNRW